MIGNARNSYFGYLGGLVDKYNCAYIVLLVRALLILAILLFLRRLSQVIRFQNLVLLVD